MGKKFALSLVFAASLLLASCEQRRASSVPTVVEPTQPVPTAIPLPTEEPTQQLQVTPVAVFGQVGYIPGVFPGLGGENWEFTDIQSVSCGGNVDTSFVRQERFTPLSEEGCTISILAKGANETSFFLVPRLDQAQYIRTDGSVGIATFSQELSSALVGVYADGIQVVYQQPSAMADFRDETVPLLGREDSTGDVWVLYVANDGSIVRRAPAFFGPDDTVQVVDGEVLVNGENMLVFEDAWISALQEPWYRNLSQSEMAAIAANTQGLFEVTGSGVPEEVPFSRLDEHSSYSELSGLFFITPTLYGVVVDSPKLELLPVTDYEGKERNLVVYTVPYMVQTSRGEYVIKDVILGVASQQIIGYTLAHFHRLPSKLQQEFSSFSVQEAVTRLTPNIQHGFRLSIWDNEAQERAVIAGNPGDSRVLNIMLINRTYGPATLEFINALIAGAGSSALSEPVYLSSLSVITLNVEN